MIPREGKKTREEGFKLEKISKDLPRALGNKEDPNIIRSHARQHFEFREGVQA